MIELVSAESMEDAEAMRVIRNSCRAFMTRNTADISPDEQRFWFIELDRSIVRPYVFKLDGLIVGYGLARLIDRKWWISGGLIPEYRGKGLGKTLFSNLADVVTKVEKKACWLEVRLSNIAARLTYQWLGFEVMAIDHEGIAAIYTMRKAP